MQTERVSSEGPRSGQRRGQLTVRESEIVDLLADGMSGAEIAAKLFVSPETVRTHIRNTMSKLGASTRSQAVVLALQGRSRGAVSPVAREGTGGLQRSPEVDRALEGMLVDLCALHDIEGGLVLLAAEDGLMLHRAAIVSDTGSMASAVPERVTLGEGAIGRVALNKRAALLPRLRSSPPYPGTVMAAPILAEGRLLGVLGLMTRASRPAGQGELLVLQVLANRVGEILHSGEDLDRRLGATVERFGASWSATTG